MFLGRIARQVSFKGVLCRFFNTGFTVVLKKPAQVLVDAVIVIPRDQGGVPAAASAFVHVFALSALGVMVSYFAHCDVAQLCKLFIVQDVLQGAVEQVLEMLGIAAVRHAHAGAYHALRADVEVARQHAAGGRSRFILFAAHPAVVYLPFGVARGIHKHSRHHNGHGCVVLEVLRNILLEHLQFFFLGQLKLLQFGLRPFAQFHHGAALHAANAKRRHQVDRFPKHMANLPVYAHGDGHGIFSSLQELKRPERPLLRSRYAS